MTGTNTIGRRAAASVTALLTAGLLVAAAPPAGAALPATPVLDVTATSTNLTVGGSLMRSPGLLTIRLRAVDDEQEVVLTRLHPGYSLEAFEADKAKGDEDPAAVARVNASRDLLGDVDTQPGRVETFTAWLGDGTYYLYNSHYGVVDPHRLTVTGPFRPTEPPRPTAVVEERDDRLLAPPVLARTGRVLVVDRGTAPHLVCLDGVLPGTSLAQVRDYLQNPGDSAPAFATGIVGCGGGLSPGRITEWGYSRPPGRYLLFDPTPDPGADGAPFALAGDMRLVTVR